SDLTVLRRDLLPEDFNYEDNPPGRSIILKGAFGPGVPGQLLKVETALSDEFGTERPAVILNVAICDSLNGNIGLLSKHDYHVLLNATNIVCPDVKLLNNSGRIVAPYLNLNIAALHDDMILSDNDTSQVSQGNRFDDLKLFDLDLTKESPEQFKLEQRDDVTLKPWWLQAANGSKEFIINSSNSLLYRKHKIAGIDVFQLVLPESKRQIVMSASHDSGWAMHFATSKTIKRIKAYYIWPGMNLNVRAFVASCTGCQKRSRITRLDKVPISAVPLSQTPFSHVHIDLVGPLEPKSSAGHSYIICLIDSATKYVDAVPLKTLTAKETYNALMLMFTRIGFPATIVSDNGMNLVAGLSKELYSRLGIQLRNSTPLHPEGNALIERFNSALKKM